MVRLTGRVGYNLKNARLMCGNRTYGIRKILTVITVIGANHKQCRKRQRQFKVIDDLPVVRFNSVGKTVALLKIGQVE